ncbi:MAG: dicarboxylate/amino acid:cation symporter [Spirochaetia bacterium]
MKIWIRFLAGIAIGVGIAFFADDLETTSAFWEGLSVFAMNLGRYMLIPIAFFGTSVAVHDLRENSRSLVTYGKAATGIVGTVVLAIALGLVAVLFLNPGPLPVILEEPPIPEGRSLVGILQFAVPPNALEALFTGPEHLLAAVVFATFLGATVASDNRYASLLEDIMDGLSRVFYRINTLIVNVLGIGLIAVAAHTVVRIRLLGDQAFFAPIILITAVAAGVLTLGIYPLLIYLFGGRWNPLSWVLGMLPPALAALVSGDTYFAGGTFVHLTRENLGVRRQVAGAIVPFTLLFARAGSAMVSSMAFILVLGSYSGLDIGVGEVLWVAGVSFVLSFSLVGVPGSGVLVMLGMLSSGYGQGLEEAFMILRPAAPVLLGIAAYVDIMTAGAVVRIVGGSERQLTLPDVSDFV